MRLIFFTGPNGRFETENDAPIWKEVADGKYDSITLNGKLMLVARKEGYFSNLYHDEDGFNVDTLIFTEPNTCPLAFNIEHKL